MVSGWTNLIVPGPNGGKPADFSLAESTMKYLVFSPPKIFFAYGFGNSLTFPFAAGATVVLMPGRPDPAAVFESGWIGEPSAGGDLAQHETVGQPSKNRLFRRFEAAGQSD